MRLLQWVLLLGVQALTVHSLDNGLALTPAMGWNSWNAFGPNINEDLIKQMADLMVSSGLRDAGYRYLVLDDAWSERQRTAEGRLVGNRERFPSGMKALGEFIHSRGLLFGIYSDAGALTCQGFPGSRGHEEVDAQTWADWEVDFLKYDNCYSPASDWVVDRYAAMRDALNATGRPILYSLCEWGVADPWLWAPRVGNSWRTTSDIQPTWLSVMNKLDNSVGLARFVAPGAWNDPDMLEVGNGVLTPGEQRAHLALWAVIKAPLIAGADLRALPPASLALLRSEELVAMHQDALGAAGDLVWKQGPRQVFAAPLADGGRFVVLLNRHGVGGQYLRSNITVRWGELGYRGGEAAAVRDVLARRDLGTFTHSFTGEVTLHDVLVLRVTPARSKRRHRDWRPWHGQPIYADHHEDIRPSLAGRLGRGAGAGGEEGAQGGALRGVGAQRALGDS